MDRTVGPGASLELAAMSHRLFETGRIFASMMAAAALAVLAIPAAGAAEIVPHRALYTMSLGRATGDAGVTGASGTMAYQWGEACDGWTVEQRYRLKMGYSEQADVDIASNFVTWESKDGLRYRFNQKETRNGEGGEGVHGEAHLDRAGKRGAGGFA